MASQNNSKTEKPLCTGCEGCKTSVFSSLPPEILNLMSAEKTHAVYKKGQVIFYEGNLPHGVFCIFSGKVKIHKLGDDGREQIVRFAKAGNVLGYRAMLSDEHYYASATALEDSTVCFFPKTVYMNALKGNPDLALQTIRLLAADLRSAEMMVTNMARKQVKERIADALIMLKEYYGTEDDQQTINASLTREVIANIAGTSTETTIRTLAALQREKVLGLVGKKIRIVDQHKLELIAHPVDLNHH